MQCYKSSATFLLLETNKQTNMSKKILAVFGATGQQGGSVITNVVRELGSTYKIRAVTRDPSKPAAQALVSDSVEVAKGDYTDEASFGPVLENASAVFLMTNVMDGPNEAKYGKRVADAAVKKGVEYLIFSTLPSATEISGGKYPVLPFDQKKECEDYIRTLPIKSAFISPCGFMSNFWERTVPTKAEDGTYVLSRICSPTSMVSYTDIAKDFGKYVVKILKNPDEHVGKILHAGSDYLSLEKTVEVLSKVTGKTVVYRQVSDEEVIGRYPPGVGQMMVNMFRYHEIYGYWGVDSQKVMAEANEGLQGLSTLESYLTENNYKLD